MENFVRQAIELIIGFFNSCKSHFGWFLLLSFEVLSDHTEFESYICIQNKKRVLEGEGVEGFGG
jgi:hypothetical protein